MGFDFNYNSAFGPYGNIYIAEFGSRVSAAASDSVSYSGRGHRISEIDTNTRTVKTFALNKSGFPSSVSLEGGFERLADVVFGPDGAMYGLDLGLSVRTDPNVYVPNTSVIWRIKRNSHNITSLASGELFMALTFRKGIRIYPVY